MVGIVHVSHDVVEGALFVSCATIHGAMFAAKIALVCDEKYGLEWCTAPEKTSAEEPLTKVNVVG